MSYFQPVVHKSRDTTQIELARSSPPPMSLLVLGILGSNVLQCTLFIA